MIANVRGDFQTGAKTVGLKPREDNRYSKYMCFSPKEKRQDIEVLENSISSRNFENAISIRILVYQLNL